MRVLLVKPEFKNVFTKLSMITTEPLELEYMSAICKKHEVPCAICDLTVRGPSLKKMLRSFQPDLVAITANFVHIHSIRKYVQVMKQLNPQLSVMVGGPHAEVMPEDFYFDGIDIVCHSGGFAAFERLISTENDVWGMTAAAQSDTTGTKRDEFRQSDHFLTNIKGISYCENGNWHKNERELFDVATLPFPDRTHFYQNKRKYKYVTMKPCAILKASYSCPNSCNYCFSTLLNGGKYLCRDPRNVVEEICGIDCDDIWIVDDTFYVNEEKLDEFITGIGEAGIKKRFSLYYRADFIATHEEHMKKLAEIGVCMCAVGLEVIDDEVLKKYNKKSSIPVILKALEVLKKCGITCIGLLMIDIDAEKSYFDKLYQFIRKYELYLSTISILTPMPGTGQYEIYKDRIMTDDYRKWDFVHLTINPTQMSRMTFYRKYYLLYVKQAMLIIKHKALSIGYIRPALAASFEFWAEVFRGKHRKDGV